ncbi:MAG: YitT family protein [Bacilli bacterium]|nr:YitT family protein [Bacilli bacterium]
MDSILGYIKKEDLIKRFLIFLLGVFILSMNYNLFVLPNNFVLGGASGMAVILERVFGFKPIISIYVINAILLVVSFLFLGKKVTRRAIVGSLLYPFVISITAPLAHLILPYLNFSNFLITVLICGCLNGLGSGLIYKVGFNTGGGDILVKLVNKYLEITEGNASFMCNVIILSCGGLVFGVNTIVYSVIILMFIANIMDKILIGISDCKMFFIYSKKYKLIEEFIMDELKTGVTVFNTEGAYKKVKREMLMVVVPTRDYYRVKERVLQLDNEAFFVVSDCYEVDGGIKRKNLPFI